MPSGVGVQVYLRLILALCAGAGTAVITAIALAVLDLYLVGHGHAGLLRESISWPAAGVHLRLLGAALAWKFSGRRS